MLDEENGLDFSAIATPKLEIPTDNLNNSLDLGGLFGGIDLGGLGALAGAIGGIMQARSQAKYQKRLADMEEARIKRDEARQDKYESGMRKAYA